MEQHHIAAVIRIAGSAVVGESMCELRTFFRNKLVRDINLLDTELDVGINSVVFSSRCVTYSIPWTVPIATCEPHLPVNPFGESQLFVEYTLPWNDRNYGPEGGGLRYFNGIDAYPQSDTGEQGDPKTHVTPLVIQSAPSHRDALETYPVDYPTVNGTATGHCMHVIELARTNVMALQYLGAGVDSITINLGTVCGDFVQDVISAVKNASGGAVSTRKLARRTGNPSVLVSDHRQANRVLRWHPDRLELETMLSIARKCRAAQRRQITEMPTKNRAHLVLQ